MTIVLTVNGESKAELVRGLLAIGEALNKPDSEDVPASMTAPVPQQAEPAPEEKKPAPAKQSAKKKKKDPEPVEDSMPEEEPETEGPTKEEVRAAAVALIKANKRDTLREILQKYGVDSITTLDAAQYTVVLPELKEALQ